MIYLIGAGGHARSILDLLSTNQYDNKIIIIDYLSLPSTINDDYELIQGHVVLKKSLSEISNSLTSKDKVYIAAGDLNERKKIVESISLNHSCFPSLIAETVILSTTATISNIGISIHHGVYVAPHVNIGDFTIINSGAILEHEVIIGQNTHIAPGAIITGRCNIGSNVFVGAGAIVTNSVKVVDNVTIGAGAVVVCDLLEEDSVYVGIPAKKQ